MGLRMMAVALLVAGASALNVGGAGVMQQRTCPAAASRATPTRMQLFGGGRKKPPADEGNIFDVPGQLLDQIELPSLPAPIAAAVALAPVGLITALTVVLVAATPGTQSPFAFLDFLYPPAIAAKAGSTPEAKEAVEGAPKELKADVKKEEAEELKAKLEGVGGTVSLE